MTVIIDGTNGVQSVSGSATLASITNINDTNTGMFFPASETIALATNGSERLRLDSAGNMGLGVTPSAWWSSFKVAQVGTASLVSNSGSNAYLGNNFYYNGTNDKRIVASQASRLVQTAGSFIFDQTATGTADSNITWTTAMTLDASGNLGVGTTSPATKLHVYSGSGATSLKIQRTTVPTYLTDCATGASNAASVWSVNIQNTSNGSSSWASPDNSVYSCAAVTLDVPTAGSNILFSTASAVNTAPTERARITSGGNLLVGATVGGARIYTEISSATADDSALFASNFNSGASGVCAINTSLGASGSANNTNCYHLRSITQGSATYYLYGNGTTSFTSDERLKKNIVSARDGYLNDVLNLRVVKYQWKSNSEDSMSELGLIAQEVEQVFPGLVQDADVEINGITPKVVKFSVLPFILLKAIQELKAELDATKARLAAAGL